jgi:hypothetical protein
VRKRFKSSEAVRCFTVLPWSETELLSRRIAFHTLLFLGVIVVLTAISIWFGTGPVVLSP